MEIIPKPNIYEKAFKEHFYEKEDPYYRKLLRFKLRSSTPSRKEIEK